MSGQRMNETEALFEDEEARVREALAGLDWSWLVQPLPPDAYCPRPEAHCPPPVPYPSGRTSTE